MIPVLVLVQNDYEGRPAESKSTEPAPAMDNGNNNGHTIEIAAAAADLPHEGSPSVNKLGKLMLLDFYLNLRIYNYTIAVVCHHGSSPLFL